MRARILASALSIALMGLAVAGQADVSPMPTHIPPGALGPALKTFAKEWALQVLYRTQLVKGIKTRGANGILTADQALALLLRGTNLRYRYVDGGTVMIDSAIHSSSRTSAISDPKRATKKVEGKDRKSFSGPFRPGEVGNVAAGGVSEQDPVSKPKYHIAALRTIVVTAQKYRQLAYNVPISLAVVNDRLITRWNMLHLKDLMHHVPGLYVEDSDGIRRIFIDGIADQLGAGALAAQYLDDADATSAPNLIGLTTLDIRTYDLSRIEVLRGPQGTLYGESAEGGAIHFVTKKPDLSSMQFGLRGEADFTKGGQPTQELFPVINIPIVRDKLGLRIAGEYDHLGGWINQSTAHKKGINDQNISDTRIEALWRPSAQFNVNLMEIIHRNIYGASNYADVVNDNLTYPWGLFLTPSGQDQYNLHNIVIQYDMPSVATIINSATYFHDSNTVYDRLQRWLPLSSNATLVTPIFHGEVGAFSDELRLASNGSSSWHWVAGAFIKHVIDRVPFGACLFPNSATLSLPDDSFASFSSSPSQIFCFRIAAQNQTAKVSSEFADVSYKVNRRVTVGAGIRNFRDQESYSTLVSLTGTGSPQFQRATFTSVDPRYYVVYKVNNHINTYVNISKGFRSGGFNSVGEPPYTSESLWHYEVGLKTHGFGGFSSTVDFYYNNWTGVQIVSLVPPLFVTEVNNVGTAHLYGAHGSFAWNFPGNWSLSVSGSYVRSRISSTEGLTTSLAVGDKIPGAPSYTLNAAINKDFVLKSKLWSASVNYYQRDRLIEEDHTYVGQGSAFGPGFYYISGDKSYLLNMQIGVDWNKYLTLGFRVENVLNDRGAHDPTVNFQGTGTRTQPLTAGVYFDTRF